MCDTFAVTTPTGTLFAKNSDRPVAEPQLINYEGPRPASNRLATQYLKLGEDPGSVGTLMTQPDWLWGAETALSTQRVAIGNEKVWTTDDPAAVAPGLIGMDLVRLAAERATDAAHAVLLIGRYLHRYGQGAAASGATTQAPEPSLTGRRFSSVIRPRCGRWRPAAQPGWRANCLWAVRSPIG